MRKNLFLIIMISLILTGCGVGATDTLSCSYEIDNNNLSTQMLYNIDYEGTEVKKVRITYKYRQYTEDEQIDGVGTGTDGTTNDTQTDNDGIIDGIIGTAIDDIIGGVADTVLDIAGIRDRHANVQNTYGTMNGFSVQNTTDADTNNYTVTYVIDYDKMTDNNLANLNLSRDINTLKSNYTSQGFSCK